MRIPTDWTFKSADVARNFEHHVREQLPWYTIVTGAVAHIARHFIPNGGVIYDIGASTGNVGRSIAHAIKARKATLTAIESAPEMAAKYHGPGKLVIADAVTFDFQPYDVAILFLVIMFIPVKDRKAFLLRLISKMNDGGCVIIVDKVHPPYGWLGTVYRRMTLAGKVAAHTPAAEVINKELSLSGVQRPISTYLLPQVGCHEFFRFGEFCGWVITKERDALSGTVLE